MAIVGAGGAGLNLVVELDRISALTGRPAPSVALVDPVARTGSDRTWCFWDAGPGDLGPAVTRAWRRVALVDRSGRSRTLDLDPLRYVMVDSADFYALAEQSIRRLDAVRLTAPALAVTDGPDYAEVTTDAGTLRARWVFDSRPVPPGHPPRTAWLQHFRGWSVRFDRPAVDPGQAVLMDFSAVQPVTVAAGRGAVRGAVRGPEGPGPGLAFSYVLPIAADRALVEHTVFSRQRLPGQAYDDALRAYLTARWPGVGTTIEAVEDGAIPMTDAGYDRRAGRRVFRLGTSGGATRGSTGYTFAAMQRQARTVAQGLITDPDGRVPVPPPAYPARHRWMDAVLLRALDRGLAYGPDLFVRLFDRNPPDRVLRFLDGVTSLPEDLAVMACAPRLPMTMAAVGDGAARLREHLRRRA